MNQLLPDLISKYSQKGLLIDTNILLLFFVGTIGKNNIPTFKRTNSFVAEDYELLLGLIDRFDKLITTPYILTEVNSMANQLPEYLKGKFYEIFSKSLANNLFEIYTPSVDISKNKMFYKFGLTDTSIESICKNKFLVLTNDFKLSNFFTSQNIDNINFNHIRPLNWK